MDNLELSLMTIEDLDLIKDLLITDFDNFWTYNTFKSELLNSNSKYFVAKINKKIVGFAGVWKAIDVLHITNIVTEKNYRNKGIGSIMLSKLIDYAKTDNDINSITLEVNENNTPAQKLYEKYDFKIVGIRKKYYNNIDNAIIMTKQLN